MMLYTDPLPQSARTGADILVEGWRGSLAAGADVATIRQTLYAELVGNAPTADTPGIVWTRVELAAMVVHLIDQLTQPPAAT